MREIYFRGKRADNGEWVYGGTLIRFDANTENEACFMPMRGDTSLCVHDENYNINQVLYAMYYNVVPETVGQFTGLTDKYGKKIFEGDFIKHFNHFDDPDKYEVYQVEFDERTCKFAGRLHKNWSAQLCKDIEKRYEVIGNIHDNPELIGGDTND